MRRKFVVIFGILTGAVRTSAAQLPMMHVHSMSSAALTTIVDKGDLVFDLGPIDLPANATHEQVKETPPQTVLAGVDGWLRGYTVELVDINGRTVPQSVVHHVNVIIPQRRELF